MGNLIFLGEVFSFVLGKLTRLCHWGDNTVMKQESFEEMRLIHSSQAIPENMSEAEAHAFWSTHAAGEGLLVEPLDEEDRQVIREIRAKLARPIPIKPRLRRRLEALAAFEGTNSARLVEQFLLERTYQEEMRHGIIS